MITPKVNGTRVVFGPCRLSYTHLFEKYAGENGTEENAKYSTGILIPKEEKETIEALKTAIGVAKEAGVRSKWSGKEPKKLDLALRNGDDKEADEYHDMYYVTAKCKTRPGIVDRKGQPITNENDIYSGVWAIVSVSFYPYSSNGNNGVACGLNNVMKWKDDDTFGGRVSADTDFSDIDFKEADDDEGL